MRKINASDTNLAARLHAGTRRSSKSAARFELHWRYSVMPEDGVVIARRF